MINAAARHDPEDIKGWGRSAALLYVRHGTPLSQAVYEIVKDKELTAEHIKRILEVANVTAYLADYDRIEGPSKVVVFPNGPATFKKVLKSLEEVSGEEAMRSTEYETEPLDYKLSKAANAFESMEKAASESISNLDNILVGAHKPDTLSTLYFKLGSATDQVKSDLVKLSGIRYNLQKEILSMFKEAINDGNSLGEIRRASGAFENSALDGMLSKVANDMTSQFPDQEAVDVSMAKMSLHKVVNEDNPLKEACSAYSLVCSELDTKKASLDILNKHKDKIVKAMKGN